MSARACPPGQGTRPRLACLARRPRSQPASLARLPWPGAHPASGPSLYLDQLSLWDAAIDGQTFGSNPDQPRFRAAGCIVRRIPPHGSEEIIGEFLARHHYTSSAGMRGLALGLYRDSTLLGIATFSRVARPRWAAENFVLLPSDRRRNPEQRRHLTVTEAEYAALSRFALAPEDNDGRALGNGAATWFLCRCLAGLEARNRLLWTAQQRVLRGLPLGPEHIRLLSEAAGADQGRGRGYLKAVVTWADPYEGMIGHIYQVLNFHYAGRTNGGGWNREAIGRRSGRRLSARTLAKARRPGTAGHVQAALRIAWEGGQVAIKADGRVHTDLSWVRSATPAGQLSEHEISGALRSCWSEWRHRHVAPGAEARCRWDGRSGTIAQRFPPKHTYLVGLGSSAWYRRHTEMRFRALTPRLLAEEAMVRRGQLAAESRRGYYPTRVPAEELKEELRHRPVPHEGQRG